jgi:hypothetical protein
MLTETGVEVNLVDGEPAGSLPDESSNPEGKDDGNGKAGLEKVLGSTSASLSRGCDGNKDLGSKNDEAEKEAQIRSVDSTASPEGDLIKRTALASPSSTEANVSLGMSS